MAAATPLPDLREAHYALVEATAAQLFHFGGGLAAPDVSRDVALLCDATQLLGEHGTKIPIRVFGGGVQAGAYAVVHLKSGQLMCMRVHVVQIAAGVNADGCYEIGLLDTFKREVELPFRACQYARTDFSHPGVLPILSAYVDRQDAEHAILTTLHPAACVNANLRQTEARPVAAEALELTSLSIVTLTPSPSLPEGLRWTCVRMRPRQLPAILAAREFGIPATSCTLLNACEIATMRTKLTTEPSKVAAAFHRHLLDLDGIIAVQVLLGLRALNALGGIVHRDIKPENLLVMQYLWSTPDFAFPIINIGDFGHARDLDVGAALTMSAQRGSSCYRAPECAVVGASFDNRTDVFACGTTVFALRTRYLPAESGGFPERFYLADSRGVSATLDAAFPAGSGRAWLAGCTAADMRFRFTIDEALTHNWLKSAFQQFQELCRAAGRLDLCDVEGYTRALAGAARTQRIRDANGGALPILHRTE